MNHPPFNKRELRQMCKAMDCAIRERESASGNGFDKKLDAQAARDAAAFARLRLKIEKMIQEKATAKG